MEWTKCLKEVLEYVEENLCGNINAEEIARRVYVSPFYLQKGFQILTGYSFGEYVRSRRLYEAACDIARGEKIIDVAAKYSYETQESFTKAFARFHGVAPGSVRRDRRLIKPFFALNIRITVTGGNKMDYTVSPMWGFKVIGFEKTFTYDEAYEKIPQFWDEICEKYCTHTIYAGKEPCCPEEKAIIDNCIGEYGVCIDDSGDGHFRYLIAGKYTGGDVPEGMTLFEFPACEWAKFECTGKIPESLQTLNTYIFREWLPGNTEFEMSGCFSIEWYSCDGEKNDNNYKSGIWVPVRRYRDEAEKLWGETPAYKESEEKRTKRSKEENKAAWEGMMEIFAEFGEIKNGDPSGDAAAKLVKKLQEYITENFYNCTDEIMEGLGEMYSADGRFKENIDRTGGLGTAEFTSEAIKNYFKK